MKKTVITVGREYGSGGYELAVKLAEALNFHFYDKELIAKLADEIMVPESFLESADENPVRRNIFHEILPVFASDSEERANYIFSEQGRFIKQLAEKENCVFIGRRADYYLRDMPQAVHIFCYADPDFKINRICNAEKCSPEEAERKMREMDKRRKTSYEYTTGRKWADRANYDLMINTSAFGLDKCVEQIVGLIK